MDAPAGMIEALLSLGLPGVMIIVLGYVVKQKDKRLDEVQDARLADLRAFSEAQRASERRQDETIAAIGKSFDAAIAVLGRQQPNG